VTPVQLMALAERADDYAEALNRRDFEGPSRLAKRAAEVQAAFSKLLVEVGAIECKAANDGYSRGFAAAEALHRGELEI